ncbi:MAG: FAD-binding oxidoreductase [Gammaproteobacteria bacterium]|nr:FAD-binding oxidoreductase [Gammaproteobacteria bacterium]
MISAADDPGLKLTPYWWEAAPLMETQAVDIPGQADVGIVGAGYAGLSAALTLARAGRSVVVFDSQRAGEGASSRNGGICSGNVKMPFGQMIQTMGFDRAMAVYGEGVAARESLTQLIAEEEIDCGFEYVGRFTGANSTRDYDRMGREADALNKQFNLGAEMVPRSKQHRELGTDFYHGGQTRPDIAGVHPGLLHRGLLERAETAGVIIIAETPVTGIRRDGNEFELATPRGGLKARDVVVATNGYTGSATPWLQRRLIPIPSQIIATDPLPAETLSRLMPKRRMCGDTRNLYNYYRPSPDGTRIIFGGRRGADTDDPRRKCTHLLGNLVEIFPELAGIKVSHSWWGYTGYSFDFLPHLAVHEGVHYATAFCGSGVVWAPWIGRKAALSILGDSEAETAFSTFGFRGRPLYWGKPWFLPAVIAWYGLKDRFGAGRI